jgi:UDP-2-acetamido-3-amino-2,3-dideoxy-glucuronate N-acetyltransferase
MNSLNEINVAIIGAGRWGKNHVRTANSLLAANQITVCDFSERARETVRGINPEIKFTTNPDEIFSDDRINAVIIATPAETHYEIAKKALESGKHVLVEKPITLYPEEAEKLLELSRKLNLKLMVGHVLLYHPAVIRMKEGLRKGEIGRLQYIYSNRLNLGALRTEENVLWSFAPHDISVIQYLIEKNPERIEAHGGAFVQKNIEDTTLTFLEYPENIKAHIFVNWLHPFKEQRMVVIGDKGMYVFEDSAKSEKLKLYHKGFVNEEGKIEKFDADYEVVEIENKMPLTEEQIHFYKSIVNDTTPRTDGQHALEVLRILSEASIKLNSDA